MGKKSPGLDGRYAAELAVLPEEILAARCDLLGLSRGKERGRGCSLRACFFRSMGPTQRTRWSAGPFGCCPS
eukprot:11217642-Lingulodinium_polyedra.AAC.1